MRNKTGRGIFPDTGLPKKIRSPISYLHQWPELKVLMMTMVL